MTSSSYYDPHPRLLLERPLVLLGHPGAGVAAVGRNLCGLTGLPFNPVGRLAEGTLGRSRSRVAVEDGIEYLRDSEWRELERGIERKPCGVVTTDPACLIGRGDAPQRRVRARALLVHLRRPSAYLLERVREQAPASPGSFPDFIYSLPETAAELERFLQPRVEVLELAHLVLDAAALSPLAIASEILAELEARPSD